MPPSEAYGPWWPRALGLLVVVAGVVIAGAMGIDLGILLAAAGGLSTAIIIVAVILRVRQHDESLHEAVVWLLLGENGRSRLRGTPPRGRGTGSSRPTA